MRFRRCLVGERRDKEEKINLFSVKRIHKTCHSTREDRKVKREWPLIFLYTFSKGEQCSIVNFIIVNVQLNFYTTVGGLE